MGNLCTVSISADQAISGCWYSTIGQATHLLKLEQNLKELKSALEELQTLRNDIRRRVVKAERRQLQQLDQVNRWFSKVEVVETEVHDLTRYYEASKKRNFLSKYKFGKKISNRLTELKTLTSLGGKFDVVAEDSGPVSVEERPCYPTVGLQSTFDSVWNYVAKDEVGIIGLYGMGGVGKTTLLTQINNEFLKTQRHFEFVVWIVASKDASVEKIQDDIGKRIGCCDQAWSSKTQDEKAMCIFRVMCNKKFVLLLDDLWERIDLRRLGIPLQKRGNKSKLVFTTRSKVVCGQMEAQRMIKVECLAWEEALSLFQDKVGEEALNRHPDIPKLAEDVAKECGGLPLALITIGRSMACKTTPQEWNHAIEVLRKSAPKFSGMEDEVFRLLKFSYDNLPNRRVKSCFLYCALFPEDFKIKKIDLIDYWIGEGLLDEYDNINDAKNCGYDTVGSLVYACLLEETLIDGYKESLKMHDVMRDMALWIADNYGGSKDSFVVQAGTGLTRAPAVGKWMVARRMSLMNNSIETLTEVPKCPKLLTLLLRRNNLAWIAHDFFQFMTTLVVLDLSNNTNITELPSGISRLVSLQYLNLSMTGIRRLPPELVGLLSLKFLNVSYMTLDLMALEVIAGLAMLQVLKMECFFISGGDEMLIEKLHCLSMMDCLFLTITHASAFLKLTRSQMLQKCTQCLWIFSWERSDVFDLSSLGNMKCLNELHIIEHDAKEFTIGSVPPTSSSSNMIFNRTCFHSLTHVSIDNCLQLRDVTWLILAPNLMLLQIIRCYQMEEIICHDKFGQLAAGHDENIFGKLERLLLDRLQKLKSIYWKALSLPHLKHIAVNACGKLKKLPLDSNSACTGQNIVIEGDPKWWQMLEWQDEETQNAFLPCCVPYSLPLSIDGS